MQLFKKLSLSIFFFTILMFLAAAKNSVSAQNTGSGLYDAQCIGQYVGEYINGVMSNVGNTTHIVYLSPAFNMTEAQFPELIAEVASNAGSSWNSLDGIAGNSYNVFWGSASNPSAHYRITDWVDEARALPEVQGRPFMLTEIGWHELLNPGAGWNPDKPTAQASLKDEISQLKGDNGILGGLLFNAFNNNGGWAGYAMTDDEIRDVCSGDCGKIGANSAAGLWGSSDADHADALGMERTLGIISRGDGGVINTVNLLHSRGIKPVIRIGVGNDAGGWDNPLDYAAFIRQLDSQVNDTVYVIVGPNEPDAEYWVIPEDQREECGRGTNSTGGAPIKIRGLLKTTRAVREGGKIRTGAAVKDAKIVAYSQVDGKHFISPLGTSTTEEDGYFQIEIPRNSGIGGYVYVVAMCGGGEEVKDLYKVKTASDLDGLFIWADCNISESTPNPPSRLEYIKKDRFYACNSPSSTPLYDNIYKGAAAIGKSVTNLFSTFTLQDDTYNGGSASQVPHSDVSQVCDATTGVCWNPRATSQKINGRDTKVGTAQDINGAYTMMTCDVVGCPEAEETGGPDIPMYPFSHVDPGSVSCEVYKKANFPIAGESGTVHYTFGPAVALSSPGDEMKKRYIAFYTNPDMHDEPICTHNGNKIPFKKFKPPENWELSLNDSECAAGDCLGPEYFPYSRLFGGERQIGQSVGSTETTTDSVGTEPRNIELGPSRTSTEILSGGVNSYKFAAERDTGKFPTGNNRVASPSAAMDASSRLNTLTSSMDIPAPPEILQDPVFGDEDEITGTLPKKYSFAKNSGYYRIGPAKNLCVCSDVDDESGDCNDPLNLFPNKTSDGKIWHPFAAGSSWVTQLNGTSRTDAGGYFLGEVFSSLSAFFQNIVSNFPTVWDPATGPQPGQTCVAGWRSNLSQTEIDACVAGASNCQYYCDPDTGECRWEMFNDNYSCDGTVTGWTYEQESKMQFLNEGIATGALNNAAFFKSPVLAEGLDVGYKALCTTDSSAIVTMYRGLIPTQVNGDNTLYNKEVTCGEDYVTYVSNDGLAEPSFPKHYFKSGLARPISRQAPSLPPIEDETCTLGSDSAYRAMENDIPDYLRQVLESAGDAYHVPAALLVSTMYSEGTFNPGVYEWTEDNVRDWSVEGPSMEGIDDCAEPAVYDGSDPVCQSQSSAGLGPFNHTCSGFKDFLDRHTGAGSPYRQDFPNRTPSVCNLIDTAYAAAARLKESSGASMSGSQYCIHPETGAWNDTDPNCNTCFGGNVDGTISQPERCEDWNLDHLARAGRGVKGFCFDNEFSAPLGATQRNPNNINATNFRQAYEGCFSGSTEVCNGSGDWIQDFLNIDYSGWKASQMFVILDGFRFYRYAGTGPYP